MTGATGFVGARVARALAGEGWDVRCLVRNRSPAQRLATLGVEIHVADALDARALRGAGSEVEVAYYLIHSMGRGGSGEFEARERLMAENFARMASREGISRVVYLGGLGDRPQSQHLRSRQRTAEILGEHGPPLTYFRAGMVVGAGSESYRTLRYLVQRLPAMIGPAWLEKPTQPIGVDDVVAYLGAAPDVPESSGREVQIGGPDVLSYGDMLNLMADALGVRRRPRVPVPLITPWLSSLWIGLVTPVDAGVARPLVESLSTPTVVTDSSGADLFEITPIPFVEALRRALADDPEVGGRNKGGLTTSSAGASIPATVRLVDQPGRGHVPESGAVDSVQAAELLMPETTLARLWSREYLERLARAYWRYLNRVSLGLVRVVYERDARSVVLLVRPLVLLRFAAPAYRTGASGGSVEWRIERGLLVAKEGRGNGYLRITVERDGAPESPGRARLDVRVAVRNFYPWLRGSGRFARLGTWVYSVTQLRIHVFVTRGFLRSLARLDLPPSRAGALRGEIAPDDG